MQIVFKSTHAKDGKDYKDSHEIPPGITDVAERKITPLKKYLGRHSDTTDVYVEFGTVSEAHQNGKIWRTQMNLDCNGKRFHADATEITIEASLDTAVKELEAELRKAKDRNKSVVKKGGGILKSLARGFKY